MKNFILWTTLICLCCTPLLSFGVKSQGPFFWQISKDHKSSYVLGTMHSGVNFEELQCHKEIKGHLLESDFLLTEARRFKIRSPQQRLIKQIMYDKLLENRGDNFVDSLNDDTKRLLQEILPERYYIRYGENPSSLEEKHQSFEKVINQLIYWDLYQILDQACSQLTNEYLIDPSLLETESTELKTTLQKLTKKIFDSSIIQNIHQVNFSEKETISDRSSYGVQLDYQILIDFLNHKQSFVQTPKLMDDNNLVSQFFSPIEDSVIVNLINQLVSSGTDLIGYIDQIANSRDDLARFIDQFPKPLDDKTVPVNQFVSTLDDSVILLAIPIVRVLTPQREDIEEWVKNFDERCSKDWVIKLRELKELNRQSDYTEPEIDEGRLLTIEEKQKKDFISGVMNLNNDAKKKKFYTDHQLDVEYKGFHIKYIMNFRNEMWRSKIIKAHEQHNSIFIAAGLAHFITQDHNPNNIRALKEYAEANKSLPTNVLDMLKEEGFTVKRMGTDCHFE